MNPLLAQPLGQEITSGAAGDAITLAANPDGVVFLLITALGVLMAIVYVPIRLFLTITARSRRLKLLQKIRRLREEIGKSLPQA